MIFEELKIEKRCRNGHKMISHQPSENWCCPKCYDTRKLSQHEKQISQAYFLGYSKAIHETETKIRTRIKDFLGL